MICSLIIVIIAAAGPSLAGGGALHCPPIPPYQVYRIPQVSPCKNRIKAEGIIETKTPNSESFVTNATLVSLEDCWTNTTTGFFGQHTCDSDCVPKALNLPDAKGLSDGFCPNIDGTHERFGHARGSAPRCEYQWMQDISQRVLRCTKSQGHMVYRVGGVPHSTLTAGIQCGYGDGQCQIAVNMWLFWDVDERSADAWSYTENNAALCDGSRVWFPSKNIGFGLREEGCKWEGYKDTYDGIQLRWTSIKERRYKRNIDPSTVQALTVMEFLYAEMTTEGGALCDTMIGAIPASTLIPHASPSLYAQYLLNDTSLVAQSSGEFLFVYKCTPLLTLPRNDSTCHVDARVSVFIGQNWTDGFMAPDGKFRKSSPAVGCKGHVLSFSCNGYPWVEVGPISYQVSASVVTTTSRSPLAGIHPNFTGLFFPQDSMGVEVTDIERIQLQLVEYTRNLGASIDGEGGGLSLVNLPGLGSGSLQNIVSFFQTLGAVGGILYVLNQSLRLLAKGLTGRRQTIHPRLLATAPPIPGGRDQSWELQ